MKSKGKKRILKFIETVSSGQFKKEFAPLVNLDRLIGYTDADLMEFKKLIHCKIEEAEKDYSLIKGILSRKFDGLDTFSTFKISEDASDVFSKEEVAELALSHRNFIERLQNSLVRLENKTYGIYKMPEKRILKKIRNAPYALVRMQVSPEIIRLN
jgi:DnaK suppressor protein